MVLRKSSLVDESRARKFERENDKFKRGISILFLRILLVGRDGIEPSTNRLRVYCSTS